MAEGFRELGVRAELVEGAEVLGYERPTPLQRAAVPVLRRGGNVLLHASAGAGVVGTYGLGLLDRLAGAEAGGETASALRALVLVPTPELATQVALSIARFARRVGIGVSALGPGWGRSARGSEFVVATPAAALEAVYGSVLKLDGVQALVLDGLDALFALGGQDAIEALTTSVPRDAQRVVVAAERTAEVADYVDRHVRRALQFPPAVETLEDEPPVPEVGPLDYVIVTEREKADRVAVELARRNASGPVVVYCRTGARADSVAEALALRGFPASRTADGAGVVIVTDPADAPAEAFAVSYDVAFDADDLAARHASGAGLVLIEPRELPHLRTIAERAGFVPRATPSTVPESAAAEVARYRARLERALAEEDIGAQLIVLEPLFARHSPAEVAAAVSALLRRRAPLPAETPATRPGAPPPAPAFVRLFVSVGSRDGLRPGDLVGSITGETKVTGTQIGRIEIRDTFSIVEVERDIAERVIQALNGITLKGRSLRVDYDRRPTGSPTAGGPERLRRRPSREPRRPG